MKVVLCNFRLLKQLVSQLLLSLMMQYFISVNDDIVAKMSEELKWKMIYVFLQNALHTFEMASRKT